MRLSNKQIRKQKIRQLAENLQPKEKNNKNSRLTKKKAKRGAETLALRGSPGNALHPTA